MRHDEMIVTALLMAGGVMIVAAVCTSCGPRMGLKNIRTPVLQGLMLWSE